MKKPDLLVLVAVWEFITVVSAFIGISAIVVFVFPNVTWLLGAAKAGGIFGLSVAIAVLLCYIGVALAGGIGLLQGKDWGRILSIAHAAASLLWIPIGTIIGILVIIYLVSNEVVTYFASRQ